MSDQDDLYKDAAAAYGAAIERLSRAYEADGDKRCDLVQDIHVALWQSFRNFSRKCSIRTWVYKVAHNTAISHIIRQRRRNPQNLLSLAEIETMPDRNDRYEGSENRIYLDRLLRLIHQLKPLDRQIMLLYLEDLDSSSIAEITGLSPGHVRIQIHRIKAILKLRFHEGVENDK